MKNWWKILKILMAQPRRVFMNRSKGIRSSALNWIINVRWQGGSATCGASALALISPTQIWQITGRETLWMPCALCITRLHGQPMVPMIAFSLWIMSHPPRRMLCWQVEVDGAVDWWPLEARARAEQWLPLIFMHTEAPHELRCATDAVEAAKAVGEVGTVQADAASLISKCESQSSRHTHTCKHIYTVRVWWG